MKELIEYIARAIVDSPEEVEVIEEPSDDGIILKLRVAPEDTGKVIGKEGRIAKAMRTLLRVAAIRKGTRATLEIISDEPREPREPREPVESVEPVEPREPVEPVESGETGELGETGEPGEPEEPRDSGNSF